VHHAWTLLARADNGRGRAGELGKLRDAFDAAYAAWRAHVAAHAEAAQEVPLL